MSASPRIVIVHDWLTVPGGSEIVLDALLEAFPSAVVRTLIRKREAFRGTRIDQVDVRTTFIDRLPAARSHHRYYLPLMPIAIEQFDLGAFDVVISNSCAVGHGVITAPHQLHVAYVNRTMDYAWSGYHRELAAYSVNRGLTGLAARLTYHYIRQWDYQAFQRPDIVVANSRRSQVRLWKHYRRRAQVIHPPVSVPHMAVPRGRGDYFVFVGRLVPIKRVDVLIDAATSLGVPLLIVGDGPEAARLKARAGPTVRFVGQQDRKATMELVAGARAFLFASDEDFGIAPVEAQLLGIPVIAFRGGGPAETIVPGGSGLLFERQDPHSLVEAIAQFTDRGVTFGPQEIATHAGRFGRERFQREILTLVEEGWAATLDGERTVLPLPVDGHGA